MLPPGKYFTRAYSPWGFRHHHFIWHLSSNVYVISVNRQSTDILHSPSAFCSVKEGVENSVGQDSLGAFQTPLWQLPGEWPILRGTKVKYHFSDPKKNVILFCRLKVIFLEQDEQILCLRNTRNQKHTLRRIATSIINPIKLPKSNQINILILVLSPPMHNQTLTVSVGAPGGAPFGLRQDLPQTKRVPPTGWT